MYDTHTVAGAYSGVAKGSNLKPAVQLYPGPDSSALPEFLPLHGLAVEPFGEEHVADPMDHRLAAADVSDASRDVGNQTVDRRGEAARAVRGTVTRARHRRMVREAGIPPHERPELGVVHEPVRVARPVGERRGPPEAGRVEPGQHRTDRHDADLLGDEERAPRVGAREDEAAERPLEAYLVAGLEAAEPLRADPCGRDVGTEREHLGGLRGRGDRVGADGLRAERDRHPLAGVELEGRRLLHAEVDLEDLGREPPDRFDARAALARLHGTRLSAPGRAGGPPRRSSRAAPARHAGRRSRP